MKGTFFFILVIFLSRSLLLAQYHDNHWIFGYSNNPDPKFQEWGGVLMSFDKGYPSFLMENTKLSYDLYCAVCSDSSGNLIFHSNGTVIQNRLHDIMENGDTLNPGLMRDASVEYGLPVLTGGMAVPAPGKKNQYFLIHTTPGEEWTNPLVFPKLYYSLIDMNYNNGLGKVITKNTVITTGELPSPVLIKHGNGRDWWILVGDYKSRKYKTILIDANGIGPVREQTLAPESFDAGPSFHKISPDGKTFVNNEAWGKGKGIWVFDFDRCNGLLSNPRLIPSPPLPQAYTLAFSPDSRFLYINNIGDAFQIDMHSLDSTELSINKIARYDAGYSHNSLIQTAFFLPELAADNKIYYSHYSATLSYHVVHQPSQPSLAADFEHRGQLIPRRRNGTWCHFPNYRLGRLQDSPCDTLPFTALEDKFQHQPWAPPVQYRSEEEVKVLKLGSIGGLPPLPPPLEQPDMSLRGITIQRIKEMQEKGLFKLPETAKPIKSQ